MIRLTVASTSRVIQMYMADYKRSNRLLFDDIMCANRSDDDIKQFQVVLLTVKYTVHDDNSSSRSILLGLTVCLAGSCLLCPSLL
jgi:hypothetical protein